MCVLGVGAGPFQRMGRTISSRNLIRSCWPTVRVLPGRYKQIDMSVQLTANKRWATLRAATKGRLTEPPPVGLHSFDALVGGARHEGTAKEFTLHTWWRKSGGKALWMGRERTCARTLVSRTAVCLYIARRLLRRVSRVMSATSHGTKQQGMKRNRVVHCRIVAEVRRFLVNILLDETRGGMSESQSISIHKSTPRARGTWS